MCLDLVFVSIFDFLCVVGEARPDCCKLSRLHTRRLFSLVHDPIIYVPWSVLLKEHVLTRLNHDVAHTYKDWQLISWCQNHQENVGT